MINYVAFGDFLYQTRKKYGLTLELVAEATGLSNKAISNIEHGKSKPKLMTGLILLDLYDIPFGMLSQFYRRNPLMDSTIQLYLVPSKTNDFAHRKEFE